MSKARSSEIAPALDFPNSKLKQVLTNEQDMRCWNLSCGEQLQCRFCKLIVKNAQSLSWKNLQTKSYKSNRGHLSQVMHLWFLLRGVFN